MPVNKKRIFWVLVFILLFSAGIAAGFFYFSKNSAQLEPVGTTSQADIQIQNFSSVRIYYPYEGRLVMEERSIKRLASVITVAGAIAEEYLKGASKVRSDVPRGAKLLGVYAGNDGVLYIDLSDEFRRNFQGDALTEHLLLKGLYESIISNVGGVDDVKVIIEGKEIESIGGHLFVMYPLKNTLAEVK
ncbi:MAG TPA: GerMN domain-containing protein [Thermodesulfovibrionales bacterium]|nr:GerMN domain-containing protein [Thermodesulfovibrionales bacterium]